ncbi:MAG: DUF1697 domain-containing protein [Opitutaceae bacterium]|nr:DUF1697 domain-containing protein [Opitutaceae bacterium]
MSPLNAKMADLKRSFESAGFKDVVTLLSSGNVVFTSQLKSITKIERTAEAAMTTRLGRTFYTIVRSVSTLKQLIEADPFAAFAPQADAKRVVTFLRETRKPTQALPIETDGARIHAMHGREVFTTYLPSPRGPVFMTLIEKTFGSDVTTRTWETVKKCANA